MANVQVIFRLAQSKVLFLDVQLLVYDGVFMTMVLRIKLQQLHLKFLKLTQQKFTCSKPKIEALEKGVIYVQS